MPNYGESKIFDTLVKEIDDLQKQLKQSLETKLKDHKSSIDLKKETINKEVQNKINELLTKQEKSIEKLNLDEQNFAKAANDCATYEKILLEIEQFQKKIPQFSIADLYENSNKLKEMLREKISKLASINSSKEAKSLSSLIEQSKSSQDYRISLHKAIRSKKVANLSNLVPQPEPFVFSESIQGSNRMENFAFNSSKTSNFVQAPLSARNSASNFGFDTNLRLKSDKGSGLFLRPFSQNPSQDFLSTNSATKITPKITFASFQSSNIAKENNENEATTTAKPFTFGTANANSDAGLQAPFQNQNQGLVSSFANSVASNFNIVTPKSSFNPPLQETLRNVNDSAVTTAKPFIFGNTNTGSVSTLPQSQGSASPFEKFVPNLTSTNTTATTTKPYIFGTNTTSSVATLQTPSQSQNQGSWFKAPYVTHPQMTLACTSSSGTSEIASFKTSNPFHRDFNVNNTTTTKPFVFASTHTSTGLQAPSQTQTQGSMSPFANLSSVFTSKDTPKNPFAPFKASSPLRETLSKVYDTTSNNTNTTTTTTTAKPFTFGTAKLSLAAALKPPSQSQDQACVNLTSQITSKNPFASITSTKPFIFGATNTIAGLKTPSQSQSGCVSLFGNLSSNFSPQVASKGSFAPLQTPNPSQEAPSKVNETTSKPFIFGKINSSSVASEQPTSQTSIQSNLLLQNPFASFQSSNPVKETLSDLNDTFTAKPFVIEKTNTTSTFQAATSNTSVLGQEYSDNFLIDAKFVGLVIGRNGSQIRKIIRESDCMIRVESESDKSGKNTCFLTANSKDSIEKAKGLLVEIIENAH
jgi:hypothetical protein